MLTAEDLKPLNHLTERAILAGMCLVWSFTKCVFVVVSMGNPRWLPPQCIVLTQDPIGKKKQIFSETIDLIVPKLYTIKHLMVPQKIEFFLCRQEIQDGCHYSVNLTQNPMGKMILNDLYQKSQNHLTANFARMCLR